MKEDPRETTGEGMMKKPVSRREFLRLAGIVGVAGGVIGATGGLGGLLGACGGATTSTTAASTATTAGSATTVATNGTGEPVKIGIISFLGWDLGLNQKNALEALIDLENSTGGLDVGGQKRPVQLTFIDTGNDQAKAKSAAQRLIFEDKVQVIMGDGAMWHDIWAADADKNKILVMAMTDVNAQSAILTTKYAWNLATTSTGFAAPMKAVKKLLPDLKTVCVPMFDNQITKIIEKTMTDAFALSGVETSYVEYPMDTTDFSAVATKTVSLNPDAVSVIVPVVMKAIVAAGYKGINLSFTEVFAEDWLKVVTADQLENFIGSAYPTEFDMTDLAKQFKAAYTKKNGHWDNITGYTSGGWSLLKAGVQKAGSMDPDKIADALTAGFTFDALGGSSMLIGRPDLGVPNKPVDIIIEYWLKKIHNGQGVLVGHMSLDEVKALTDQMFAAK